MNRTSPARYALFLLALVVVFGGAGLAKGGLYIGRHEGDTAHMVEIVLRMLGGQVPHLDFSTPIGFLAFAPVAVLVKSGLGMGQAFIAAQMLIALLFVLMIARVALSRLSGLISWAFGFVTIAMITALVHGEDTITTSVSMYYNRWAWAAAFVLTPLAVFPAHKEREAPVWDGIIVGLMLAVLALVKPTYFVSFVIPAALGFVLRGAFRSLSVGLLTGIVVAGLCVLIFGAGFFPAYIADLLSVTQSDTRAAPGVPLMEVVHGPRFLIGTLLLLCSIIVLRQAGQQRAGLVLFLLAPGFVYVTYQNFGNDPKWLMLLAIFLLAHRADRGRRVLFNADARNATGALALTAFALIAPSFQNLVTSPFRHLFTDTEGYIVQLKLRPETRDIFVDESRSKMPLARVALVDRYPGLAPYVVEDEEIEPVVFLGEELPRCTLQIGDIAVLQYMADRLKEAPYNFGPDNQFFITDIASGLWILGGFEPLLGGAPWYYSGTPGIENADAIIVPTCPLSVDTQRHALAAIEQAGLTLRPPLRDAMMLVYPIVK